MKKYWENKPDQEVDTGKNVLRYWKEVARLQISMPNWTDKDGGEKPGKTVTLSLDALRETPEAVELIEKIVTDIS